MKELTKAEEQIMQLLWQQKKAFIKDIMDELSDPKPAYNTVATILKILYQKEFVDYKTYGNAYQYYPLISNDDYYGKFLGKLVNRSFNNSFKQLVSMFSEKNRIDMQEADEIIKMMEELKKQQNG